MYDELLDNLGYENSFTCTGSCYYSGVLDNVPSFVYNSNYSYWTMSPKDNGGHVWSVLKDGIIYDYAVQYVQNVVVRPVIVLPKSALQ